MTFAILTLIYHLKFVPSSSILYMKEAMPDLPEHAFYKSLENAQPYPDPGKKEFAWHTNQVIHPSDVRPKK